MPGRDPVEQLRRICLALPEATERVSHGEPAWFVRYKRLFVTLSDHHHDDRLGFWCAAPPGAQQDLVALDPTRYFVPKYVGGRGWLGVYLDVPDFESTREEKADVLPVEDHPRAFEPPTFPPMPPETPPGLRAALEQLMIETRNEYPTARSFKPPAGIPAAVVVTTRADRLEGNGGPMVRLHIKKQQEWALSSPNGLFVLAGHSGHQVQRNDPALVSQLVSHVLKYAGKR